MADVTTENELSRFYDQVVSFTDKDVQRESARPILRDGWYCFRAVKPIPRAEGNGDLTISVVCVPLDPTDETTEVPGYSLLHRLTLPIENPEVDGHNPRGAFTFKNYILGAMPDRFPQVVSREGRRYLNGQEIDRSQVNQLNTELSMKRLEFAKECLKNPMELCDVKFYGRVNHDEWNGRLIPRIKVISTELPGDEALVERGSFATTGAARTTSDTTTSGLPV